VEVEDHREKKKKLLTLDYTPGCSFYEGAKAMQIGIVAKKVGLSVDAIRFYERNALLPRPARTQGGFRQYGERDIETLAFIRRVQGLGFKLSEIRGLLSLRGSRMQPCAPVRRRLQAKLADVRQKLENLQKLDHELRLALRSCDKELRKQGAHCPVLRDRDALNKESGE
jgi:DNA-binding transcriptional MerR regulator